MFSLRKFISALLALLIPTASAVAISACREPMPEMSSSPSQMAMMDMVSPQVNFAAAPGNLCCQVVPAETTPGPVRPSLSRETHLAATAATTTGAAIPQTVEACARF